MDDEDLFPDTIGGGIEEMAAIDAGQQKVFIARCPGSKEESGTVLPIPDGTTVTLKSTGGCTAWIGSFDSDGNKLKVTPIPPKEKALIKGTARTELKCSLNCASDLQAVVEIV